LIDEELLKPIVQRKREKEDRNMSSHSNVNETTIPDETSVRNNFVTAMRMAEFHPIVGTGEVNHDPMVVSQLFITNVAYLY
jgi:hypothetical protein